MPVFNDITVDKNSFGRFVLLSLVIHCVVLAAVWRFGTGVPAPVPVHNLAIDMAASEPSQQLPQVAVAAAKPRAFSPVKTLPASFARPRTVSSPATPPPARNDISTIGGVNSAPAAVRVHEPLTGVEEISRVLASTTATAQSTGADAIRQPQTMPAVSAKEPSLPVQGQSSAKAEYLALLRGIIARQKEYPLMARKGGMEGTVLVGFTLVRDGTLKRAVVVRSSGRSLLDKAAVQTLSRVGKFPPVPESIRGSDISMEVPVVYTLTGK